jgi:hypothetical protein
MASQVMVALAGVDLVSQRIGSIIPPRLIATLFVA